MQPLTPHLIFQYTWYGLGAVAIFAGLGYLLSEGITVLLLAAFAVVLAIGLVGMGKYAQRKTRLSYGFSLALVATSMVLGLVLFLWYLVPAISSELASSDRIVSQINDQLRSLQAEVPEEINVLDDFRPESIMDAIRSGSTVILNGLQNIFGRTFVVFFNVLVVFMISLYIATQPQLYTRGLINMLPTQYQSVGSRSMSAVIKSLRLWLLARIASMAVIAGLTYIMLLILGIPLAFSLAVLAGLLSFIPNLGPVLSVIPAGLVALTLGLWPVVYIVIGYFIVQMIESHLVTPQIEQHMVNTPPAILLFSQLFFGSIFGFLGLLLAAPLVASVIALWSEFNTEVATGE